MLVHVLVYSICCSISGPHELSDRMVRHRVLGLLVLAFLVCALFSICAAWVPPFQSVTCTPLRCSRSLFNASPRPREVSRRGLAVSIFVVPPAQMDVASLAENALFTLTTAFALSRLLAIGSWICGWDGGLLWDCVSVRTLMCQCMCLCTRLCLSMSVCVYVFLCLCACVRVLGRDCWCWCESVWFQFVSLLVCAT